MQIPLVVNAIDSLNWSLKHLNAFLKKDPYFEKQEKSSSDLKQAIINLNSCLELLFKKCISDINETLIYDYDKSSSAILEFYKLKRTEDIQMTMYDYFIMNDKQVVTIPYNKCIDYFCELYDVGDAYKHSFQSLNHLRNTIMHLGVNYKEQYYVLVGCIDKALWFIQYEIINKLIADGNVGKHLEIALFQIENTLSEIEDVLWKQLYQPSINTFAAKVDDAFHDTIVQEYLKTKKRTIEVSPTTDMDHACLRVTIEDAVLEEEMFSAYHDPPTNSIIIDDGQSNAVVMAVFCLNDNGEFPKKFYLSKDKDGVLVAKIDHQSKFWLQAEYKNCFHYLDCNKQNLTKLLTTIIDYCDDAKFSTTQT